jgi:hypothetical protein
MQENLKKEKYFAKDVSLKVSFDNVKKTDISGLSFKWRNDIKTKYFRFFFF